VRALRAGGDGQEQPGQEHSRGEKASGSARRRTTETLPPAGLPFDGISALFYGFKMGL
jgi:hypothetical protein